VFILWLFYDMIVHNSYIFFILLPCVIGLNRENKEFFLIKKVIYKKYNLALMDFFV